MVVRIVGRPVGCCCGNVGWFEVSRWQGGRSMSNREQLNLYLSRIEKRLRLSTWSAGVALTLVMLVLATVLAVLLANHFAFSSRSVTTARLLLFVALASAVALALVLPLLRLNRRNAARRAEG